MIYETFATISKLITTTIDVKEALAIGEESNAL